MDKYKLLSKNSISSIGKTTDALANYVSNENDFVKMTNETKEALEKNTYNTINKIIPSTQKDSVYMSYKPKSDIDDKNIKLIAISENPIDPCMPSKFKHRKLKKSNDDVPVPILSSPKKKLTTDDHKKWIIPPCLSLWKNKKGYTLPLHMRISADLRGSKNIELSDKFAQFNDVFNLTEKQIRNDLQERNKLRDAIKIADQLKKEQELLELSKELNEHKSKSFNDNSSITNSMNMSERNFSYKSDIDDKYLKNKRFSGFDSSLAGDSSYKNSEFTKRNNESTYLNNDLNSLDLKLIETRNKIRELNEKKFTKNYNKDTKDESKQILTNEDLVDSRLYNKTSGLQSGFRNDDDYNIYDKPLFNKKPSIYNIRPSQKEGFDENKIKDSAQILEKIKMRGELFKGVENALSSRVGRNDRIEFHKEEK